MLKKLLFITLFGSISAFAGQIEVLNEQSFAQNTKSGKVLVDFYAQWCGPCKRLGSVLEMVQDDMGSEVKIFKVDIDASRALADRYEVKGVPTMILFEDGKVKGTLVGFRDKSAVKRFIDSGQ